MENRARDILYCGVDSQTIYGAQPKLNDDVLEALYEFVVDRYLVRLRKDVLKLPAPWTDNPILQVVKFTNVRREHDRESRNLIDNIASKTDVSIKDRIFNIMLMRFYNKYESYKIATGGKLLQFPLTETVFNECLQRVHAEEDHTFWSGAYYTAPVRNWKQRKYKDSVELESGYADSPLYFAREFFTDALWDDIVNAQSPKEIFDRLKQMPSMGNFICYQWFVDYTYCPDFWFSENEFTISGPGCSKGIDLLFADKDGMSYEECLFWMRDNQHLMFEKFGYEPESLFMHLPKSDQTIGLMSFENLMCELQKYLKCKLAVKEGRKPRGKSSYDGVGVPVVQQIDLFDLG
jgi:hypothetical protein